MKIKYRIRELMVSICLLLSVFGMTSQAASGSVSVSGTSGNVGSTVSVTVTIKCSEGPIGSAEATVSYDPSALQYVSSSSGSYGSAGSVTYASWGDGSTSSLSFSIKFKILKEGSHKVSVTSADGYTYDEQQLSLSSGSATVTGKVVESNETPANPGSNGNQNNPTPEQPSKSNNNKLNSLKVYPGSLSPAFSAGTKQYTVKVGEDVTEVTISAVAQDSKANVSVSGGKNLQVGSNQAKVVVTAENGGVRSYNITIVRGENTQEPDDEKNDEKVDETPQEITATIDGTKYVVNEVFAEEEIPAGFTRKNVSYSGKDCAAVSHEKGKLTLMNLTDENGKSEFFIYDSEKQRFYPFLQMQISEVRYIIPLPLTLAEQTLSNVKNSTLTLQEKEFDVWQEENGEFYILNAMSNEGTVGLYRYDIVDATCQRYVEAKLEVADTETEAMDSFIDRYGIYIIAGLGVLVVLLTLSTVCLAVKKKPVHHARRNKHRRRRKKEIQKGTN